jgi:hypothetical protein
MGVVRVILDGASDLAERYHRLDEEMLTRGWTNTAPGDAGSFVRLPRGTYWHHEPTHEVEMAELALEALSVLGEAGTRVVATAGPTAHLGLEVVETG